LLRSWYRHRRFARRVLHKSGARIFIVRRVAQSLP
jgi:hypothetical protein